MSDTGIRAGKGAWQLPRWSMLLLIASLAFNLIVVGLVAGSIWRVRAHQPPIRGVTPNLLGYAASLPLERRDLIWTATAEQRQQIRPFRRDIRAAREEVMHAIATEPFDGEKFAAAQGRLAEAYNRARAAVLDLDLKIAVELTPEERRAFPAWREQRRPSGQNLLDEPDRQVNGHNQQTK
ncbi:MAG TPA: periplasmic heavy metal sensor [Hyphomicrobiaceae bacterium]|nr:periplasmic heavy metal sensor [Hyphomicrobiaceae bacterium]